MEKIKEDKPWIHYSPSWWRAYRLKNAEHLRAYKREYDKKRFKTHGVSENARRKRWKIANPEKALAQRILNEAIRKGAIKRMPCEVCNAEKSHGHHEDYTKPLEVKWLCALHHSRASS